MAVATKSTHTLQNDLAVPRPVAGLGLEAYVAYARDRDPFGHRVHVIVATIGCGLLTLSTVTATIALFGLVGWSLARSWVLWPLWLRLFRHPLMLLVIAFFMWSAVSLTWSTNVAEGAETLRAQRYLLLIPAFVPVLGAVRWLLLGVLAGVMVQSVAQVLVFCGMTPWSIREAWTVSGGISKHPGSVGAWAAIAVGITLSPALGIVWIGRGGMLLTSVASVFIASSRSGMLSLALFCVLILATIRGSKVWHVRCGVFVVVGAVALAIGLGQFRGSVYYTYEGAIYAWRMVTGASVRDNGIGIRFVMARAAWQVGAAEPWTGVGLGTAREAVKSEPVFMHFMEQSQGRSLKEWQGDLHGGWAESFAELGIPGFLLFIVPVFMALRLAVRCARSKVPPEHAWGPAVLAAVLTWLAFGMFNVMYSSGQLQAMAMFAVTLAIGAGAGLFATGTGMQRHTKVPHEDNT